MKKRYLINFTIKDSIAVEAENGDEAEKYFLQNKELSSGSMQIEGVIEFDHMEAKP